MDWKMEKNLRTEIDQKIKQILISKLDVNPTILAETNSNTPLLGRGIGLDSIEALALVAAIEKEFDIEIGDEDITVHLFRDTGTLSEYILRKIRD